MFRAHSHRRSTRRGFPLAAVLVALVAVGPVPGVAPLTTFAVSPNAPPVGDEEADAKADKLARPARPQVGPPAPPRSAHAPARPVPPAGPRLSPRHLRPAATARGPAGPYLRC